MRFMVVCGSSESLSRKQQLAHKFFEETEELSPRIIEIIKTEMMYNNKKYKYAIASFPFLLYKWYSSLNKYLRDKVRGMAESKRVVYEKTAHDTSFRRTWDKEEFERRARERARQEREQQEDEDRKRKGIKPKYSESSIDEPPRDLLRARTERVILDANLNKTQVVQSTSIASKQPGFYCKECDCVVKDSVNYLDHINGKKHQRALGMSMKVERSTIDQIKAKFEHLKKKKEEEQQIYGKYAIEKCKENMQKFRTDATETTKENEGNFANITEVTLNFEKKGSWQTVIPNHFMYTG
ncbi:19251_t:CDS:2, partial [Dentiscutata erythropus]